MSLELERARAFEREREAVIRAEDRPGFHLSARVGWMNDPNGFSFYKGKYHLFYQYHPYDSHWGPMHWGHAVSRDLLRWDYLPAALAPDAPYDGGGCYSGSALELPDGRQLLMYTGVAKMQQDGEARARQTQNLAFGDGVNFEKYAGNPVLTEKDLPAGGSPFDFRDPKITRLEDGSYRAVAADDTEGGGQILLFRSADALKWERVGVLAENRGRIGKMWECPDLFRLDGRDVLLLSAQDMLPKDFEYHNGDGAVYFLGDFDEKTGKFTEEADYAVDYGIDFYAPQTILTPDGRRVMIGWLQNWDTCNLHTPSTPWFGQMSLPRELTVKNGRLYQNPVRELEALRAETVAIPRTVLEDNSAAIPGACGRMADLELEIGPDGDLFREFTIRFAEGGGCFTAINFRPGESILKIDRKFSGSRRAIIHQRRAKVRHDGGRLKLRVILDRFSAEVFVNDGEKVLSAMLYTDLHAEGISFCADGRAVFRGTLHRLDPKR